MVDGPRVTVRVYVLVLDPSVTTIVIALAPTFNGISPDAVPDATEVPFTFIVPVASPEVGTTVIWLMVLITDVV